MFYYIYIQIVHNRRFLGSFLFVTEFPNERFYSKSGGMININFTLKHLWLSIEHRLNSKGNVHGSVTFQKQRPCSHNRCCEQNVTVKSDKAVSSDGYFTWCDDTAVLSASVAVSLLLAQASCLLLNNSNTYMPLAVPNKFFSVMILYIWTDKQNTQIWT